MEKYSTTAETYQQGKNPFEMRVGPQRSIINWTMTSRELYHLQFNDHQYGSGSAYGTRQDASENLVTRFEDMPAFRDRWRDFDSAICQILQETDHCIKWKIAVVPDLARWSSEKGRIILIGDAAHAFPPYVQA